MPATEGTVKVSVTFRHTEPTPALKTYAIEKVTHCLQKYITDTADAQLVLSIEKRDHCAEIKVLSKRYEVAVKAVTDDLYSAIDKLVDTVETQIRKQKERLVSHKHQGAKAVEGL